MVCAVRAMTGRWRPFPRSRSRMAAMVSKPSKAGSAELTRGRGIRLCKGIEYEVLLILRNANPGIAAFKMKSDIRFGA